VRKKVIASLIYPSLLIVIVILVVVFLVTYVVPSFATLYTSMSAQLPAVTLYLIAIGTTAKGYVLAGAVGLVLLGFAFYVWSKGEKARERIDRVKIKMPVFGDIWIKYQVGLFSRTLSTLLTGGLPLVPSLETAARSIDSRQVSKAVYRSVETVREGKGLSVSLQATKVFPELAIEMIEVGESTGALPQMLNSVAEFFEEDVQTNLTAAMSLIEPLILIVMGVVVVTILIALYLPIFSLSAGGVSQ